MGYIRSLDKVTKDDLHLAGGKASNLGEMIAAGFPVPEELRSQVTLDRDQIRELCRSAVEVENRSMYPRDIEWAYEDGDLTWYRQDR